MHILVFYATSRHALEWCNLHAYLNFFALPHFTLSHYTQTCVNLDRDIARCRAGETFEASVWWPGLLFGMSRSTGFLFLGFYNQLDTASYLYISIRFVGIYNTNAKLQWVKTSNIMLLLDRKWN